jgi:hypothetical protein
MRYLLLSIALLGLLQVNLIAQNPFDYGQSEEIYFMSAKQLQSLEIENIQVLDILNEPGGMHEDISLFSLDFSWENGSFTEAWFIHTDTAKTFIVDSVMAQASYVNSTIWNFKDGYLNYSGNEGYGTMCSDFYEILNDTLWVESSCEKSSSVTTRKITYRSNGLPDKNICCLFDDYDLEEDEPISMSENTFLKDTLTYVYDKLWRVIGLKRSDAQIETIIDLDAPNHSSKFYQVYIKGTEMEAYADRHLGFRPTLILMEMYRKGAITFTYSKQLKKYLYTNVIVLE